MSKAAVESRTDRKPAPKRTKRRTVRAECCDDACLSGKRNRYYLGKRLTPETFRIEQDYLVERRRLLNRAMFGWGVAYGYPVAMAKVDKHCPDATLGRLHIGSGLALDRAGRELVQVDALLLGMDSVSVFDWNGELQRRDCGAERIDPNPRTRCWLLSVHYAERPVAPLTLHDPCSCERNEWDQVCETVHYSVRPIDCKKCCAPQPCELECCCGIGPCCGEYQPAREPRQEAEAPYQQKAPSPADTLRQEPIGDHTKLEALLSEREEALKERGERLDARTFGRGGCRCLCDHLTALEPGVECGKLCEVETECGPLRVDLRQGVPLACVALTLDRCGRLAFEQVLETCGPRRLLKRNDLLFDLIRGCDLTRVSAAGWAHWHRADMPVPFEEFDRGFGTREVDNQYVTSAFWVEFSHPVRVATLRPDAFVMTVIHGEEEAGWRQVLRVPIVHVHADGVQPGDPPRHARRATIVVDGGWVGDALRGRRTIFDRQRNRVEITVRGDYIIDCNGQRVDGNVPGLAVAPTGNGVPGDDLVSTFMVGPRLGGDQGKKAF